MTRVEAEQKIAEHLDNDERLLWTGFPREGLVFRKTDVFMIPFSLLWGGFAVFWEASVIISGAPLLFVLWGVPFVLIGIYLIVGRFLVDAKIRVKTAYGLTDRRVIILNGLFSLSVKSLQLRTLSDVTLQEDSGGTGTITFGPSHPAARWYAGTAWPGMNRHSAPAFEMIPEAKDVFSKIREAQNIT